MTTGTLSSMVYPETPMNKSPIRHSPNMSLLSACLTTATTEMPNGLTIRRRLPPKRLDSPGLFDPDRSFDPADDEALEPPESLSYSKSMVAGGSGRLPFDLPETATIRRRNAVSLSPSKKHDLASSPLSSRPYQTLTKEYDMDTWRMYQRIQTARANSQDKVLSLVQQTVNRITPSYDSIVVGHDYAGSPTFGSPEVAGFPTTPDPQRETEEFFELEL